MLQYNISGIKVLTKSFEIMPVSPTMEVKYKKTLMLKDFQISR